MQIPLDGSFRDLIPVDRLTRPPPRKPKFRNDLISPDRKIQRESRLAGKVRNSGSILVSRFFEKSGDKFFRLGNVVQRNVGQRFILIKRNETIIFRLNSIKFFIYKSVSERRNHHFAPKKINFSIRLFFDGKEQ